MPSIQKQHQNQPAKPVARTNKVEQKPAQLVDAEQMMHAPETLRSEDVLAAQQQVGNQVVQRSLSGKVADKAVSDKQGNLAPEIAAEIQKKRGAGTRLPDTVRKDASKTFGKDFKNVRVHVDDTADALSRRLHARAFTIGSDIFFKRGVFAPGSSKGRETLYHELTHVVQQSRRKPAAGPMKLGAPGTSHEKEADLVGKKHSAGTSGIASGVTGVVQKQHSFEEEEIQAQPQEEEELQMQAEEEELQMQPEVGGTIQRELPEEEPFTNGKLDYKKYHRLSGGGSIAPGIASQVEKFGGSNLTATSTQGPAQKPPVPNKPLPPIPAAKSIKKPIPPVPNKPLPPIPAAKSTKKPIPPVPNKPLPPIPGAKNSKKPIPPVPNKPLPPVPNVIPEAPPLPETKQASTDAPASFADQIKAKSQQMRSNSQRGKLAQLDQNRQKEVGERVSSQYMEDQAKKPKSKMDKFKGFMKSVGSKAKGLAGTAGKLAMGKIGGLLKGQLSEAKGQFLGKSETEAPSKEPQSGVTVNVGGGGGGGGAGNMAETIADLFQENKRLKAQIAELEKKEA